MKNLLLSFLFCGLLLASFVTRAQSETPAPVEYSERVPADGAGKSALYRSALNWTETHFAYGPKSNQKTDATTGTVRLTGTGKVKPVDTKGREKEITVLFDFNFRANDNGYEYSVGSFRVIADPEQPSQTEPLDTYLMALRAEKSNERTHNERRVTAQATSLASEAAMSFRSYMNSQPTDVNVGLAGEN
ncbi:DUF4468 domain-containing protein [Hymenobacter taeanensis]|uniref:DUF4468 domain-containing protein n=1 Tax=Hymenobacter taeanensis TaxID=2735321 RepID=A0A6M6BH69_9BACT|nr:MULTISPECIES: DUF4468 domain-containing protein [Hymenobacter]QJX46375.1 DUF4468 domain-containing protein [Hymenobacter taeanensis]UOQ80238.1 DUF4468 domain-containing protein [Hymenobacter sp. 5414T-23]